MLGNGGDCMARRFWWPSYLIGPFIPIRQVPIATFGQPHSFGINRDLFGRLNRVIDHTNSSLRNSFLSGPLALRLTLNPFRPLFGNTYDVDRGPY
ncbi:MAG: hypothetical protein JWM21_896 [Acidobacteria bacterium]|nr:hypothetical protein [Acidobacteriota bacterium]